MIRGNIKAGEQHCQPGSSNGARQSFCATQELVASILYEDFSQNSVFFKKWTKALFKCLWLGSSPRSVEKCELHGRVYRQFTKKSQLGVIIYIDTKRGLIYAEHPSYFVFSTEEVEASHSLQSRLRVRLKVIVKIRMRTGRQSESVSNT